MALLKPCKDSEMQRQRSENGRFSFYYGHEHKRVVQQMRFTIHVPRNVF